MTKHTPATPLPITTACDEEFRANAEEGRKYRIEALRKAVANEAETVRRANAYPRLVEALRSQMVNAMLGARNSLRDESKAIYAEHEANLRALLAELGE